MLMQADAGIRARHDHYADDHLRRILRGVHTIAMVGASPDWNRPSSFVMKYLQSKGYRVIPVNPKAAGRQINGETCYASLLDVPVPVDVVNVFRAPDALPGTHRAHASGNSSRDTRECPDGDVTRSWRTWGWSMRSPSPGSEGIPVVRAASDWSMTA